MKSLVSAVIIASSLVVTVVAQNEQPGSPAQQPTAQKPSPPSEQPSTRGQQPSTAPMTKVTIAGCVQNAPPPAGGASASTSAASKFDLANAKVISGTPVGTAGAGAAAATRYGLEGDEKTITPHVNQQVEITGTVSRAAGAAATAAPMLKVESVKMVSAKCETTTR